MIGHVRRSVRLRTRGRYPQLTHMPICNTCILSEYRVILSDSIYFKSNQVHLAKSVFVNQIPISYHCIICLLEYIFLARGDQWTRIQLRKGHHLPPRRKWTASFNTSIRSKGMAVEVEEMDPEPVKDFPYLMRWRGIHTCYIHQKSYLATAKIKSSWQMQPHSPYS